MSTVDPIEEKRRRASQPRRASSPGRLLLVLLITVLAAAISAWMLTRMIVDGISSTSIEAILGTPTMGGLIVVTFLGIMRWSDKTADRPGWLGWGGIFGSALLAGALGSGVSAPGPLWFQPIVWNASTIGFGLAGIGFLILSVITRSIRLRQKHFADDLVRSTSPVTAVVTSQGYRDSHDWVSDGGPSDFLMTEVVYTFTDHQGTQRWVTRIESLPYENPLANGDEFDLWFDRSRPDKMDRMIIRPKA